MTYEIIVTSASRPHLLQPTLETLLGHVDPYPSRILIHNDAAFGAGTTLADHRWMQTKAMLAGLDLPCELVLHHADPPRRLGMALAWLIGNVTADYVLYSQDDFVTLRGLPIRRALAVMAANDLHQIRFNKRATLGQKDTWKGVWKKQEVAFCADPIYARSFWGADRQPSLPPWHCGQAGCDGHGTRQILTVSDHWYFQTGLWRTSVIRAALFWLTQPNRLNLFAESSAEETINSLFDGEFGPIPGLTIPHRHLADVASNRARVQKTFIWGPIGEDRYVRHIGTDPADWAGQHRREPQERDPAHHQRMLDELASQRLVHGQWIEPAGEI